MLKHFSSLYEVHTSRPITCNSSTQASQMLETLMVQISNQLYSSHQTLFKVWWLKYPCKWRTVYLDHIRYTIESLDMHHKNSGQDIFTDFEFGWKTVYRLKLAVLTTVTNGVCYFHMEFIYFFFVNVFVRWFFVQSFINLTEFCLRQNNYNQISSVEQHDWIWFKKGFRCDVLLLVQRWCRKITFTF